MDKKQRRKFHQIYSRLKQRCQEMKKIEMNSKALVVFRENIRETNVYKTKYKTRDERIKRFKNRIKNEGKEDLSKALVLMRELKVIAIKRDILTGMK